MATTSGSALRTDLLGPRKTIDETLATREEEGFRLRRELGAWDVTVLGIGVTAFVYAGALVATLNTVMILMLGQSRVAFAMARDRMLPPTLARTHPTYGTPYKITIITVVVVAVLAGLLPIGDLAELVNIGTLFAFGLVAFGVLYLRRNDPSRPRPFRTPFVPVVPLLAIAGVIWLMTQLSGETWLRFGIWMALGVVVHVVYSRRASLVSQRRAGRT